MREITNLIDAGLVHVPPIHVLLLEDAALAHQMIDTGRVRGKLVLKVAELYARSPSVAGCHEIAEKSSKIVPPGAPFLPRLSTYIFAVDSEGDLNP
jgi:hypothetical protein